MLRSTAEAITYSGSPQPEIRSNVKMIAIATASQKPRCLFASIFSLRYGQRGLPFGNPRNDLGGGTPPLPPRIGATSRPIYYWHVVSGFWLRVCVGRTSPTSAVPAPAAAVSRYPPRRFNVGGREKTTSPARKIRCTVGGYPLHIHEAHRQCNG